MNKYISNTIKQEGAFKSSEKLTFDFSLNHKLSDEEIDIIEKGVNELINSDIQVETKLTNLEQAKQMGAVAHFTEVYSKIKGDLRLVCMGELKEICGGTHVGKLNEIESFMITKVIPLGSNKYRIEAITSNQTINEYISTQIIFYKNEIEKMTNTLSELKINDESFNQAISKVNYFVSIQNLRNLNKDFIIIKDIYGDLIVKNNKNQAQQEIASIKAMEKTYSKSGLFSFIICNNANYKNLVLAINQLINEDKKSSFIGFNVTPEKTQYIIVCQKDSGLNAGSVIASVNRQINGTGGGNNISAMGGVNASLNIETIKNLIDIL
jgi:alanyl-tRNA synthetase